VTPQAGKFRSSRVWRDRFAGFVEVETTEFLGRKPINQGFRPLPSRQPLSFEFLEFDRTRQALALQVNALMPRVPIRHL
jgi:hypothetical protein